MANYRIVIAASVVEGEKIFSHLGDVTIIDDTKISTQDLQQADALIIRSKTQVNDNLLKGTSVKFVATATSGVDHIQLTNPDITVRDAKGANAHSVADYVMSSLLYLASTQNINLSEKILGIIGYGCVGKRVAKHMRQFGMTCLACDPLLSQDELVSQAELLQQSDIVTLHVPLTMAGQHPTYNMVDEKFLSQLKPGTIFINTSRGEVVDEVALLNSPLKHIVLDVWRNEPEINLALCQRATIATAHIAGYSWPGRLKGTLQVYKQLCDFLKIPPQWSLADLYQDMQMLHGAPSWAVMRHVYDVSGDSIALKAALEQPDKISIKFKELRANYRKRDEWSF